MQLIQAIILGIVQGVTEFIPVSSSGHLLLVGHFMHFKYSGLGFDTALDIGTLAALFVFFRNDFMALIKSVFRRDSNTKLAWLLVAATVPGVIVGLLVEKLVSQLHDSPAAVIVVAVSLIAVAVLMLAVDKYARMDKSIDDIDLPRALIVGLAQAVALIPGVSRSGITITAARAERLDRVSATRFSFLLSAPIILGATAKETLKHTTLAQMSSAPAVYILAILAAAISGYLAIKFLLNYLSRHGLALFAYYRLAIGLLVLLLAVRR